MTHSGTLALKRLTLTDFRNYAGLRLDVDGPAIALTGPNGAGKTNLLEAISLLAPGRGLRGAAFEDLARQGGSGTWAIAVEAETPEGPFRSAPAGAARAKATVPPRAGWFWSTGMSRRVPAPWASSCGCCGSRRPWTGSLPARPPTGAASWTGWWRPSIPSTPPACWFSKRSCASATFCWRIRVRMEPGLAASKLTWRKPRWPSRRP
ncbi:MAG: hypothetical protein EHM74_04990, partial [Hyphomicrobiales bacterium]